MESGLSESNRFYVFKIGKDGGTKIPNPPFGHLKFGYLSKRGSCITVRKDLY